MGVGVGSLVVDKDTPVSTTQEPVFPPRSVVEVGHQSRPHKKFC